MYTFVVDVWHQEVYFYNLVQAIAKRLIQKGSADIRYDDDLL